MKEKVKVFELFYFRNEKNETILHGTKKDICNWAKDLWTKHSDKIKSITNVTTEEEYYYLVDGNVTLSNFLPEMGYSVKLICEVPLDDFNLDKPSEELVDAVLAEIKKDIANGDLTALDELIRYIPVSYLMGYLPEK